MNDLPRVTQQEGDEAGTQGLLKLVSSRLKQVNVCPCSSSCCSYSVRNLLLQAEVLKTYTTRRCDMVTDVNEAGLLTVFEAAPDMEESLLLGTLV